MPFRSTPAALILAASLLLPAALRAEDPFLGQIKEIKCVGCQPGWVTLVIHDPIETRDFELYLKDTDYNKIITPLPGKRIHDRNGECFYWMEKPKNSKGATPPAKPEPAEPVGSTKGRKGAAKGTSPAKTDSVSLLPVSDSESVVAPPEAEGTPSTCIRFFKQPK